MYIPQSLLQLVIVTPWVIISCTMLAEIDSDLLFLFPVCFGPCSFGHFAQIIYAEIEAFSGN